MQEQQKDTRQLKTKTEQTILNNNATKHYWYSVEDGHVLLMNIRKRHFTFENAVKPGEEYSAFRENKEGIFIADPYSIENFAQYFEDDIKRITEGLQIKQDDPQDKIVQEKNIQNNSQNEIIQEENIQGIGKWKEKPRQIVIPLIGNGHWRAIRITIDYNNSSANVLLDDPFGGLSFTEELQNKLLDCIKTQLSSKLNIKHVEQAVKKIDQQGAGVNGYDCGPIVFSNISDYVSEKGKKLSNKEFSDNKAEGQNIYTVPPHDDSLHDMIMAEVRYFDRKHYDEILGTGVDVKKQGERLDKIKEQEQKIYQEVANQCEERNDRAYLDTWVYSHLAYEEYGYYGLGVINAIQSEYHEEYQRRRLHDFLELVEGNHTCTAAYIDGEKMYMAANDVIDKNKSTFSDEIDKVLAVIEEDDPKKIENMISELSRVKASSITKNSSIHFIDKDKVDNKGIGFIMQQLQKNHNKLQISIDISENSMQDSINNSFTDLVIAHTALNILKFKKAYQGGRGDLTKNLSDEFKKAIKHKKIISLDPLNKESSKQVKSSSGDNMKGIHAEMKLLTALLSEPEPNKEGVKKEVYIATSKPCCPDCYATIKAVNAMKLKNLEISVIGGHASGKQDNWPMPEFMPPDKIMEGSLDRNDIMKKIFGEGNEGVGKAAKFRSMYNNFRKGAESFSKDIGGEQSNSEYSEQFDDSFQHEQELIEAKKDVRQITTDFSKKEIYNVNNEIKKVIQNQQFQQKDSAEVQEKNIENKDEQQSFQQDELLHVKKVHQNIQNDLDNDSQSSEAAIKKKQKTNNNTQNQLDEKITVSQIFSAAQYQNISMSLEQAEQFQSMIDNFLQQQQLTKQNQDKINQENHLKRSEKSVFTESLGEAFSLRGELYKGLNEEQKLLLESIENRILKQADKLLIKKEAKSWVEKVSLNESQSPKIEFMAESDHSTDHGKNIAILKEQIEKGTFPKNTVIMLERKELGDNMGMKDIRVLAEIIDHNVKNIDDKTKQILIPKHIIDSNIYRDAELYRLAVGQGIKVIGAEGKGLNGKNGNSVPHIQENEYNEAREEAMAKSIREMQKEGLNVVMLVGSAHIEGLTKATNLGQGLSL